MTIEVSGAAALGLLALAGYVGFLTEEFVSEFCDQSLSGVVNPGGDLERGKLDGQSAAS